MFWATYLTHGLDQMHDSGLLTACRYFFLFLFFLSRGLFLAKADCFYSQSVNTLSLPPPEHASKSLAYSTVVSVLGMRHDYAKLSPAVAVHKTLCFVEMTPHCETHFTGPVAHYGNGIPLK